MRNIMKVINNTEYKRLTSQESLNSARCSLTVRLHFNYHDACTKWKVSYTSPCSKPHYYDKSESSKCSGFKKERNDMEPLSYEFVNSIAPVRITEKMATLYRDLQLRY